jgi:hypothetical protein
VLRIALVIAIAKFKHLQHKATEYVPVEDKFPMIGKLELEFEQKMKKLKFGKTRSHAE